MCKFISTSFLTFNALNTLFHNSLFENCTILYANFIECSFKGNFGLNNEILETDGFNI